MSRFAIGLCTLLLFGSGCDNEGLVVTVSGLPADAISLRVRILRNGERLGADREVSRTLDQFVVTGVEDGDFALEVAALGSDRCILANTPQPQPVSYRSGSLRPTQTSVALSPSPDRPCELRVVADGDVTVWSTPARIACGGVDGSGRPQRSCSDDFPRGTRVELHGRTSDGFKTYATFGGACTGIEDCVFDVAKAGEVRAAAAPRACNAQGWCYQNPLPQSQALRALWGFGANDIWAVGDGGTVLHYDGQSWTSSDIKASIRLRDVWGAKPDDIWVVSDDSAYQGAHYVKGTWSLQSFMGRPYAVSGSSAEDVWIAGASGFGAHYDGKSWKEVSIAPYGSSYTAMSLWMGQDGSGWLIDSYSHLSFFDKEKSQWTKSDETLSFSYVNALWGAAGTLWAVGDGSGVAHVTNMSKWSEDRLPAEVTQKRSNLYSVWASGVNDVWAVGQVGMILHSDGTRWTQVESPTKIDLYAIWGSSATDIWAVGGLGKMIHWDGTRWSLYSKNTAEDRRLKRSWGADPKDVWAVGPQGTIMHWDGSRWRLDQTGRFGDINAIWGSGSSDVWAVGNDGLTLRYDGTEWKDTGRVASTALTGLWISGPQEGWAVGSTKVLNLSAGTWKDVALAGGKQLTSVWGTSQTNIWFGGTGTTFSYKGSGGFDENRLPMDAAGITIQSLWSVPGGLVWAISGSQNDPVYIYNGSSWSKNYSLMNTSCPPQGLWGFNVNDVYVLAACGGSSTIYRFDGSAWAPPTALTNAFMSGLWGTKEGHLWAVGDWGVILHRGPTAADPGPRP